MGVASDATRIEECTGYFQSHGVSGADSTSGVLRLATSMTCLSTVALRVNSAMSKIIFGT